MKLLTQENRKALPSLYSQDGKGEEAIAHVKFFDPQGSLTWYATEFDGTDLFFGLVISDMCSIGELGYFSLKELESTRGALGLPMERDRHFKPTKLKDVKSELFS